MEKVFLKNLYLATGIVLFLLGCATSAILEIENAEESLQILDYEKSVKIKEIEVVDPPKVDIKATGAPDSQAQKKAPKNQASKTDTIQKKADQKVSSQNIKRVKHMPELEGQEGFDGRRPILDPFVPGEKVSLRLSYFNITAGTMTLEVLPFVKVNNKESYHFKISGKSNGIFSKFYSIDDWAETFVDYETMIPHSLSISVKETKQLREIRSYFDWKKNKAKFWEKKITKKHGLEEKNFEWDIEPYAQNVLSAAFYMRVFPLVPGTTIQFRIADNKKNMVVTGHVLKKEKIKTAIGEFDTVKIKPEIEIDGIFKPIGDVFFWLTDDERKLIVRLESKIKIGTILGSVIELEKE